ncbi:Protein serine/threonine kinase [Entamoeba marina]
MSDKSIPFIYLLNRELQEFHYSINGTNDHSKLSLKQCTETQYICGDSCCDCDTDDLHCSSCSSADVCTDCEEGYSLSEGNCILCVIDNCYLCSTTSYSCSQCYSDFYPNESGCSLCSSKNCSSCSKTTGDCTQCLTEYTLSGTNCVKCSIIDSLCLTCSQTDYSCLECSDFYIVSSDGLSCLLCPEGQYKYNETTCEYCYNSIDNCQSCSDDGNTCSICYEPYVLSNNDCVLCESNQYYSNNNCNNIITTCNEQINSTTCISCISTNYLYEYQCFSQNECTTTSNYGCDECSNEQIITTNGTCLKCKDNYHLTDEGNCENILSTNCEFEYNSKCRKCNDGYYLNTLNECIECDDNCNVCSYSNNTITYEECLQCNGSTILTTSNECIIDSNCNSIKNNECIECNDGYYTNNGECTKCNENCKSCNLNECIICNDNYLLDHYGICQTKETFDCLTIKNGTCIECDNGYELGETELNPYCFKVEDEFEGCYHGSVYYNECIECLNEYIQFNGTCYNLTNNDEIKTTSLITTDSINDNCKYQTTKGCIKCVDGYYLESGFCYECSNGCETCYNSTMCLSCNSTYYVDSKYECSPIGELLKVCTTLFSSNKGCVVCNDGYYKEDVDCIECDESCLTCINSNSCLTCNNDYYQIIGESGLCTSYSQLTNCLNQTSTGCVECNSSYYLNNYQCYSCKEECLTCSSSNTCTLCIEEYVLIDNDCVHYTTIEHCSSASNSTCTVCSGLNQVKNGIECKSNTLGNLCFNLKTIEYESEIEVNEETRELLFQISTKEGCDKYEIRTNPQLITIPKGKAVEFEIFIKPLCTCKINDQFVIIALDIYTCEELISEIGIKAQTEMTTRLDYDELIEDMKLGEGSFGIVYKGTFRGNHVAIKKMKQLNNDEKLMEEFNKEVSMLDKFRNDYIVHFYGAVFIPTKICMVTEFAQYGSLQDLMNKTKENPIDNTIKIKILLDCSKGIEYLHSNGILHRDIKPDNILILSLENDVQVNAKLTDFGASRNINMLMTNMTFTKELEHLNKYKKSADVYSFAITIYETITWNNAYPKSQFVYRWDIAKFITNGKRLEKPDTMNESIYSLITNCWKQEPKERYEIENVIEKLEEMK